MILLDNKLYVLNACQKMASEPGYRVIPLGISCLTGESLLITSLLNFLATFFVLYYLLRTFKLDKKTSLISAGIFGFNSYVSFPFFYAAAHSYVYTILATVIALWGLEKFDKLNIKNFFFILFAGILLKLVRSEGALYFGIGLIAYLIFQYMQFVTFKEFAKWLKQKTPYLILILLFVSTFNFLVQAFVDQGEEITKNLSNNSYTYQFPKESFKAVAIWATFDYLKAFIAPFSMNFYGNYLDWFQIHQSKTFQFTIYSVFGLLALVSTYFILTRRKTSLSYIIIGFAVFMIPGFLISSFLRNQWFYPSRSLLGCTLSIPFFIYAALQLKNKNWLKPIGLFLGIVFVLTFFIHISLHFKDERTMYTYENKFLGIDHPTLSKMYAQLLFKENSFLEGTKVLRKAAKTLPEEGVYLSANHFFLWAENLYWSAAGSYYFRSPLTEEKVLKKLYEQPNFFAGLACLQDNRVPLEMCSKAEFAKQLCHPVYKQRFGFNYYKKPRLRAEQICSKYQ